MGKAVKKAVDELIAAIEDRPASFQLDEHTLTDTRSHIKYWITSGFFNYGIYRPYKLPFGFYHGLRFGRAVTRLKAYRMTILTRKAAKQEG